MPSNIHEISKVLAILLVEQGSYSYIDKISQTSSKDLVLYHVREALRDFHSLRARGFEKKKLDELAQNLNFQELENEISEIAGVADITQLREKTSLIAAQALAEAGRIMIKDKYSAALKICQYLKDKNLYKGNEEELSKIIYEKREELGRDLKLSPQEIEDIANDKRLLKRVIENL
ncbi:MAG: hypothetical protein QW196_01155 [Sulfolobales archaeon]